jgi:hypothetical protein
MLIEIIILIIIILIPIYIFSISKTVQEINEKLDKLLEEKKEN